MKLQIGGRAKVDFNTSACLSGVVVFMRRLKDPKFSPLAIGAEILGGVVVVGGIILAPEITLSAIGAAALATH